MKRKRRIGKVILAGAGPGDPGLLTLKGAEALGEADVVVYDWLVNPALLEHAPQAEKIYVGKKGGDPGDGSGRSRESVRTVPVKQEKINRLLVRLARAGKTVVRLKGGDPFIFGRGGEEAGFLAKHRVPFEVIPGVSAGIGAPAYAGIPLTDRRFASQVTFVTGHEQERRGGPTCPPVGPTHRSAPTIKIDWKQLAGIGGTLVSFMGVKNLPVIVKGLVEGGRAPRTPVAVIEWGTLPHQRVIQGNLKEIVQKCREAGIQSPALAVIGEVVHLRKTLDWFRRKKPLAGKTVVVTRARSQASELVRKLSEKGARVFEFPTIEILPPSRPAIIDREIRKISTYDWVVFTSVNGVRFFFERLGWLGLDARIFSGLKIAALGEKTAGAIREKGLKADLVPKEFTSLALFKHLKNSGEIRGKKFLLARADIAPPDLRQALEKGGALVKEIEVYRTRRVAGSGTPALKTIESFPRKRESSSGIPRSSRGMTVLLSALSKGARLKPGTFLDQKIDYITFTSSSTVKNFFDSLPAGFRRKINARFVTIGPVTTRTLRQYGFKPFREAEVHTIEGLIEALTNGGRL